MIVVKLNEELVNMSIIQIYMPTTGHDDEEVDTMYEKLQELVGAQIGSDHVVITGDWNAVVGEGRDELVVGKFELGLKNERGEKLIEFF